MSAVEFAGARAAAPDTGERSQRTRLATAGYRRWRSLLLAALVAAALLLSGQNVRAQVSGVTPDQIEAFKSLPQDQQDAILRQFGISGASSGLGSGAAGDRQSQNQRNRRGRDQNQDQDQGTGNERDEEEENSSRFPRLKAEDWVIIETDFTLPPRPVALSLAGLDNGQSAMANSAAAAQAAQASNATAAQAQAQPTPPPQPASQLTDEERRRLQDMMELIRSRNPYRLGRDGSLLLPGFQPMALLGLTDDQATLRLKVEPAFRNVDIRLTRLPLKRSGSEGLKHFGYDLFDRAPSTFAPVTDIPVPADYVLGPGDELQVQLYGKQNRSLRLTVSRDGRVSFPDLGPINVGGQLFSAVKSVIESRVERQMIGERASVSMGDTRSIRVFVLGEARHPGSYVISGLGTITSALFAAGGVRDIGSLRNITLKRQGAIARKLDLYDLLIRGDTSDDAKLLQGDVIFVPPIGNSVSVDGEVRRPAIYEIKNESSIADLLQLAGGLTPDADRSNATLTRIDERQRRVVVSVDLSASTAGSTGLLNGDLLKVARLRPTLDSGVLVQGHVFTPGTFAYHSGLRLSDVIHSVDDLKPDADIHYLLIRRELPPDRRIAVLSADLSAALKAPGGKSDLELMPRDRIIVFDLSTGRDRIINPVLQELHLQSSSSQPMEVVQVDGRVKIPGRYPLESGMTVADLIRAGGGLADAAYSGMAELTRYQVVNGEARRTELIPVDIAAAVTGDPKYNITLQPFDNLSVRQVPEWVSQESVTLQGEVRFPGTYAIKRGETLRTLIQRAGGLTEYAFADGAALTREELRKREQEQMDVLADRMQHDLAVLALQGAAANQAGASSALSVGQTLLSQLRAAKAVGRLVIDLPRAMHAAPGSAGDVIVRNGDLLVIPRFQQQVTVIGEVQNSTSHLYDPHLGRDDYIALSGGTTKIADRSKIYVVRANGSVISQSGNRWFQGAGEPMKPGDTVVVPLDTERIPALPFWQAVTQILYNVAISVAAVHSL